MAKFNPITRHNLFNLTLVLLLFLVCVLGCKSTIAPQPSWTKTKVLAENEDHPSRIISDGSFVYFVTGGTVASQHEGTNTIKSISLKDGSVSLLVKGGERIPGDALTVDDKFVYWSGGGNILRVPKVGGASGTVVPNTPRPSEMLVDSDNIYWLVWTGERSGPQPVMFAPKKGGEAKQFTPTQDGAHGLCLYVDTVYWTTAYGIKKAPKAGGEASVFYPSPNKWPTIGLAQDAENFYYAQMDDRGHSALMKLLKKGGAATQLAPEINHTCEFVVDDTSIHYFDNEPGGGLGGRIALRKVSKSGGEPVTLDRGIAGWINHLTVDKTQVYLTDIANVFALPK